MGIFDPLVLRGVPLNGLETLVDFVSGLGVDSLAGNDSDLGITTVCFTVASVFRSRFSFALKKSSPTTLLRKVLKSTCPKLFTGSLCPCFRCFL